MSKNGSNKSDFCFSHVTRIIEVASFLMRVLVLPSSMLAVLVLTDLCNPVMFPIKNNIFLCPMDISASSYSCLLTLINSTPMLHSLRITLLVNPTVISAT